MDSPTKAILEKERHICLEESFKREVLTKNLEEKKAVRHPQPHNGKPGWRKGWGEASDGKLQQRGPSTGTEDEDSLSKGILQKEKIEPGKIAARLKKLAGCYTVVAVQKEWVGEKEKTSRKL